MHYFISRNKTLISALTSLLLVVGLSGCGGSTSTVKQESASPSKNSASPNTSTTATQLSGISATGEPGKKPTVKFDEKITVADNSHKVLIEGNGAQLHENDMVCTRTMYYPVGKDNTVDTKKAQDSWNQSAPECSVLSSAAEKQNPQIIGFLLKQKIGASVVFGFANTNTDAKQGPTKADTPYYLYIVTIVSSKDVPQRASGTKVADIPSNLPKVTLAANGQPSIDLSHFQDPHPGKLTTQVLIKGHGPKVKATDTVAVQYTGWLGKKDGTQFDSSWSRGAPISFALNQVVKGWGQGLTGQTVGSQVLLIIPPSLGYGDQANSSIPANSTLIFVVDILSAS